MTLPLAIDLSSVTSQTFVVGVVVVAGIYALVALGLQLNVGYTGISNFGALGGCHQRRPTTLPRPPMVRPASFKPTPAASAASLALARASCSSSPGSERGCGSVRPGRAADDLCSLERALTRRLLSMPGRRLGRLLSTSFSSSDSGTRRA
jgi:hypothetical protein